MSRRKTDGAVLPSLARDGERLRLAFRPCRTNAPASPGPAAMPGPGGDALIY